MKKTTIYDIAAACKVSPRTVTRAFQENSRISVETRKLVLEAADKYEYKPNIAATRLAKPAVKITAVIIKTLPLFADSIVKGFKRAHSELRDYKAELDIITAYTDSEIEECCETLDEKLINHDCDGLIVMCMTVPEHFLNTLIKFTDNNVPVVKILNTFDEVPSIFDVKNDYVMSGRTACELLSVSTGNSPVILFTGSLKTAIHREILNGFTLEANRRGITVSTVYDMNDDPELARNNTENILTNYQEARGIYITSANSVKIIDTILTFSNADEYKIVASDIFPELENHIKNETVFASIFQNETYQAKTAYKNLYEYIAYNKTPSKEILTFPQIILKSNLNAFV